MEAVKLDKKYTYSDYCKWDDSNRWELIDGTAYAMAPAPSEIHHDCATGLFEQLRSYLSGKECKVFIAPFDVRLNPNSTDDTVVQPDVFIVCDESKRDGKSINGAPDFIAEVISPSSSRYDKLTKHKLYQNAGVKEYWIVDPVDEIIAVNILINEKYEQSLYGEGKIPVFILENCEIDFADIFG